MDSASPCQLTLPFAAHGFFPYVDAIVDKFWIIENQVLFQTGVGDAELLGGILDCDITVGSEKVYSIGILLSGPGTHSARQSVVDTEFLSCLLTIFEEAGVMFAELIGEVSAVEAEFTGNLRDIALDIFHAVTGLDSLLIFCVGGRALTATLFEGDICRLFGIEPDTVSA